MYRCFGKDESFYTLKGMAETVADVLHLTFLLMKEHKSHFCIHTELPLSFVKESDRLSGTG